MLRLPRRRKIAETADRWRCLYPVPEDGGDNLTLGHEEHLGDVAAGYGTRRRPRRDPRVVVVAKPVRERGLRMIICSRQRTNDHYEGRDGQLARGRRRWASCRAVAVPGGFPCLPDCPR